MRRVVLGVEAPRERLRERPAAGALAVELELARQPVEPVEDVPPRAAELERADDRREAELALADKRFRVDRKPRLTLGAQHVVRMQVLVDEHLLALGRRELAQRIEGRVEQPPFERAPPLLPVPRERLRPP